MSWQEQIEQIRFKITTGDGREFLPLWKTTGRTREYNTSIYDFIGVDGSLVDRKRTRSAKHDLVFYFQGETNTTDVLEFDTSAADPRAWEIVHPFYGTLRGQPLSIQYNEDSLNVTVVTVEFWESIIADFPDSEISVGDAVRQRQVSLLESSSLVFASDIVPVSADIQNIRESNEILATSFEPLLNNDNNADFQNTLSRSLTSVNNILDEPLNAIRDSQAILSLPSEFTGPILTKINAYRNAFNDLVPTEIDPLTVNQKLFFEAQGAALIASLANASVNPSEDDYVVRTEIEAVVGILIEIYDRYLSILDASQVQIYDVENTYIPNVDTQTDLYNAVTFTAGNLFMFAFEAQQERIVFTESQTNCILLAHRFLGPSIDDSNLENFIENNNIKLRELFIIPKGREIRYFV